MTSGRWQMAAAGLSVVVMIVVLVAHFRREDNAPEVASTSGEPHVGTKDHTAETTQHQGETLAPIQVYADSQVGDWRAYRVVTESTIGPTITSMVMSRISEVEDTTVTRAYAGRVESGIEPQTDDGDEQHPRRGLTIDQLTGNDIGGWTIFDLQITDDDHEVGGRRFKCKKISYASNDPMIPKKRTRTELWISAEIPAGGIVDEREVQEMPNMRFVLTQQLVGFGTAAGTTWGTRPEGL